MTLKVYVLAEPWLTREANGIATVVSQLRTMLTSEPGFELARTPAEADVVHAHTTGARYLATSLVHRKKLIVSTHVLPGSCMGLHFERLCRLFTRPYLRFAYSRARCVISLGDERELLALGVRAEIVLLPNAVDRARFQQGRHARASMRQRLGIAQDAFVVLGVGQTQPRKGIMTFCRVAAMLPQHHFIWVGGQPFGPVTANPLELSRLLADPPPNMTFTGIIPWSEMPQYYGLADAFLFPSYQEVCPLAVLEAGAAGLPLVLRNNSEYPGVFSDHYIAAADDPGFRQALQQLHADESYRARWQQEAGLIAEKYDLDSNRERLLDIYRSIAQA